jgi:hypothetical protein
MNRFDGNWITQRILNKKRNVDIKTYKKKKEKMILKSETKRKLKNIAVAAYKEWGPDLLEYDNAHIIYYNTGKKTGNYLTRVTINKWLGYLSDDVKRLKSEDPIYSTLKQKETKKVVAELNATDIKNILLMFNGGTYKEFENITDLLDWLSNVNVVENKVEEEKTPAKLKYKDTYTGLFHYSENEIRINQHSYAGCVIWKDGKFIKDDILRYFNKVDFISPIEQFKGWMIHQLNYYYAGKLDSYHKNGIRDIEDTKKDVKLMTKMLKNIFGYEYLVQNKISEGVC